MFDPFTVQPIINYLDQTSRKWATEDDLRQAVTVLAEGGRTRTVWGVPDEDYIIKPIDWSMLATDATETDALKLFREDMQQKDNHGCSLNAVRFVLQRRYNVAFGFHRAGDYIVLALIENEYRTAGDLLKLFTTPIGEERSFDLPVVKGWLASLGIKSYDPVLVTDIPAYVNFMRSQLSGMLLVAGDIRGLDHTYVLYEFRTVAGKLEAKIYNPATGMNLVNPTAVPATDWYDIGSFQTIHGLPVLPPDGKKIPNPTPGGSKFLRPKDPQLTAFAPLHYSVLFVPAL